MDAFLEHLQRKRTLREGLLRRLSHLLQERMMTDWQRQALMNKLQHIAFELDGDAKKAGGEARTKIENAAFLLRVAISILMKEGLTSG